MLVLLIMYDHLKIIVLVSYDFMANLTIEYSFPIK